MFDKDAIKELTQAESISAAQVSVDAALGGEGNAHGVTALPEGFQVHDLEAKLAQRRRARGKMTTSSVPAFAAYVAGHNEEGASVFVDQDAMRAVAVLNLGTPINPGHSDNLAVLAPKATAAYTSLLKVATGQGLTQTAIAEFIEDWMDNVRCLGNASETDDPVTISARQAAAAVRRVTIEAIQKLENTEGQLNASRSALESVKASSGGNPLPAFILFKCVPYHGLGEREFTLRLGVQTGALKPALVLRIATKEKHDEAMAEELAELVREAVHESMPCLIGAYQPLT